MESEGAVEIFARSVEARNLIYKKYVGDGDSKVYSAVRYSMPYGPLIYIVKEECKSHITKRMGTFQRHLLRQLNWPKYITCFFCFLGVFFEKSRYYCKKYCESCKKTACGSLEKELRLSNFFLIS